jgi:hypothetical protein
MKRSRRRLRYLYQSLCGVIIPMRADTGVIGTREMAGMTGMIENSNAHGDEIIEI